MHAFTVLKDVMVLCAPIIVHNIIQQTLRVLVSACAFLCVDWRLRVKEATDARLETLQTLISGHKKQQKHIADNFRSRLLESALTILIFFHARLFKGRGGGGRVYVLPQVPCRQYALVQMAWSFICASFPSAWRSPAARRVTCAFVRDSCATTHFRFLGFQSDGRLSSSWWWPWLWANCFRPRDILLSYIWMWVWASEWVSSEWVRAWSTNMIRSCLCHHFGKIVNSEECLFLRAKENLYFSEWVSVVWRPLRTGVDFGKKVSVWICMCACV